MIKVLPKEVSDKIAAGEVIESPASIVKELVENSIDAGATSITCEITKGGKEEIRITDNGCGIPSDQVETAFLRHATSKITSEKDLKHLVSLGFRGEALASIAAVSRTELITKTPDEKTGTKIIIHGGSVVSIDSIGCPNGTTIIVRDLFYNVPARAKFMKSEASEAGKIIDIVSKLAITKADIRFTMISNGKNQFTTAGRGDLKAAILSVYKDKDYKELMPIDMHEDEGIRIQGFVSRPSFTRTNRRSQYYFVNGRPVKDAKLEKGIDLGYKERLFDGRHPIVFLFVDIDPEKLDVNVHPNKKEVRFSDSIDVISSVRDAVLDTITSHDSVIKATDTYNITDKEVNGRQKSYDVNQSIITSKSEQLDIKQFLETQTSTDINTDSYAKTTSNNTINSSDSEMDFFDEEESIYRPFDFSDLTFIGALFDTYLMAIEGDNLYLFDQHACHERVNYERFVESYKSGSKDSQILMLPFTLDLPLEMAENEGEWLPILEKMGYSIEAFGDNTYIFREIPAFLSIEEAESFAGTFIDSYGEDLIKDNTVAIDKLISKACKASVKANDRLTEDEIKALIEDLKSCHNPFSCPHGRPTFIKFTKYEIEKMFKRVV